MNSNKRTARIVGVLFIIATVASILGLVLIGRLDDPDYLIDFSANENSVLIGVLFEIIAALAVAGTGITLFAVFRKHNGTLALWYAGGRIIESVPIIVGALGALLLLTLSQEFVSGAADAASSQTFGTLLVAVRERTNLIGPIFVFSVNATILNYLWYRSRLVPRFLWVWGFIGATLILAVGLLRLFGLDPFSPLAFVLVLPIAVYEMVLAVWLIVKGFSSSAIASEPA